MGRILAFSIFIANCFEIRAHSTVTELSMASTDRRKYRENCAGINFADAAIYFLAIFLITVGCREKPPKNTTFLHKAAWSGDIEKTKSLIANGADVNAKDSGKSSPLHLAASFGHSKVMKSLLVNAAEVNANDIDGDTPLHNAAFKGHKEVVNLLLSNGADVKAKDSGNRTPLDEAVRRGHKEIIELLGKNGEYK